MRYYRWGWITLSVLAMLVEPAVAQSGMLGQSVCLSPAMLIVLAAMPLETVVDYARQLTGLQETNNG